MTQVELDNVRKYLKAPSLTEIDAFIKELGITDAQFERYYEMRPRTMSKIRFGIRKLPRKFWHFVYEKKVPEYGIAYKNNSVRDVNKNVHTKRVRKKVVNVNRLTSL